MVALKKATAPDWIDAVKEDLNTFLADHASCERKASATAMSLVAHYPDKPELVSAMIALSIEELEHFQQVYEVMEKRGARLLPDEKDAYVRGLLKEVRKGTAHYFLDRLLVAAVVEARGCERFGLLGKHLPDAELRDFYTELARAEGKHQALFFRLAKTYFPEDTVKARLEELLVAEAELIEKLPHRAALH
jgi:tRNA-(ms[2]io[6]A)-hydroxylase